MGEVRDSDYIFKPSVRLGPLGLYIAQGHVAATEFAAIRECCLRRPQHQNFLGRQTPQNASYNSNRHNSLHEEAPKCRDNY